MRARARPPPPASRRGRLARPRRPRPGCRRLPRRPETGPGSAAGRATREQPTRTVPGLSSARPLRRVPRPALRTPLPGWPPPRSACPGRHPTRRPAARAGCVPQTVRLVPGAPRRARRASQGPGAGQAAAALRRPGPLPPGRPVSRRGEAGRARPPPARGAPGRRPVSCSPPGAAAAAAPESRTRAASSRWPDHSSTAPRSDSARAWMCLSRSASSSGTRPASASAWETAAAAADRSPVRRAAARRIAAAASRAATSRPAGRRSIMLSAAFSAATQDSHRPADNAAAAATRYGSAPVQA